MIVDLRRSLGSTTVTISHDMKSTFRIADRIGMLHEGRIIAIGTPEEIRACPDGRVQQFIEGRADGPLSD